MTKIPFSTRRSGRYYFRRRVRLHDGKDIHVIVPLSTCDGQEARERAAILAAQFDRVRRTVNAYFNLNQTIDPAMLKGLFENELRHCLAAFVSEFHEGVRDPRALIADHRTHASAYDIAQRPGTGNELTAEQREKLAAAGHDEMAIEWVACDLDRYCGKDSVGDDSLALMAEGLGFEPTDAIIGRLRHIHLQARAEAHRLAAHFMDEDVQSAFDQEEALLAKRRRGGESLTFAPPAASGPQPVALPSPVAPAVAAVEAGRDDCLFKTYHATRFSSVIPKILRLARAAGHWNRGMAQYERVLRTFAWVTGDKPLRTDEVHLEDAVPNLVIKNNDLRAEDGVDGGEKNIKRGRMIPLHNEILRLGFAEYVQAIRAEGHAALFPELYLNEARIGGHQFRNIAWGHMRDWIGLHMPIPVNVMSGKQADMHSIRSLGSSFYATSEAPDLMRADVMGHARTGTNALHYSKRTKTHGVDKVLAEYKAFMARWTDVATDHLQPKPVKLLPINHRSRTGKPRLKRA